MPAKLTPDEVATLFYKKLMPSMLIALVGPEVARNYTPIVHRLHVLTENNASNVFVVLVRSESGQLALIVGDSNERSSPRYEQVRPFMNTGGGKGFQDGKFFSSSPADEGAVRYLNEHVATFEVVMPEKPHLDTNPPMVQDKYYSPQNEPIPQSAQMPIDSKL